MSTNALPVCVYAQCSSESLGLPLNWNYKWLWAAMWELGLEFQFSIGADLFFQF